jgi:hypothetical protein
MRCGSPHQTHILVSIAACVLMTILICLKMQQAKTGVQQDEAVAHVFHGMSDASATAVLSDDVFVVADDESSILRW